MAIRNKDGSLFKLQGINPLMKDQDHWKDEWTVHYVEAEEVFVQDSQRIIPEGTPDDAPVPAIIGVGIIHQTEILYCLPLFIRTEEDPLYGQKRRVNEWGEKFSFEAITVDCNGLTAIFFARMPKDKVPAGSIIYVFKERNWWKVNGVENYEDGIHIYCMPSEMKPSFL